MPSGTKNRDAHVAHAEEIARGIGFGLLRGCILELSSPTPRTDDVAVDVGAGRGLLTLPLAERVSRLWAIDISPLRVEYLHTKAASAGLENTDDAVTAGTHDDETTAVPPARDPTPRGRAAKYFRAFADHTRLSSLEGLSERELSVGEIVTATGQTQPNISNHLACLR